MKNATQQPHISQKSKTRLLSSLKGIALFRDASSSSEETVRSTSSYDTVQHESVPKLPTSKHIVESMPLSMKKDSSHTPKLKTHHSSKKQDYAIFSSEHFNAKEYLETKLSGQSEEFIDDLLKTLGRLQKSMESDIQDIMLEHVVDFIGLSDQIHGKFKT
jgi:hypothetical protein